MGQSVLVFVSHSSDDKESLIEPIVSDLESCFINIWLDKRKIIPGDNLRKSIFRDGLDKADIALIFFTEKSLQSSWVDREIKHVLREESKKGNNFDLKKIISIFDSQKTFDAIAERYPELTDDLLHLMPANYSKIQIGQLISAIWSKYLSLQGGDIATQKQLLIKDREIFQKEKELLQLRAELQEIKANGPQVLQNEEFRKYHDCGKINEFIKNRDLVLRGGWISREHVSNLAEAAAFDLVKDNKTDKRYIELTEKGRDFFKWYLIEIQ